MFRIFTSADYIIEILFFVAFIRNNGCIVCNYCDCNMMFVNNISENSCSCRYEFSPYTGDGCDCESMPLNSPGGGILRWAWARLCFAFAF